MSAVAAPAATPPSTEHRTLEQPQQSHHLPQLTAAARRVLGAALDDFEAALRAADARAHVDNDDARCLANEEFALLGCADHVRGDAARVRRYRNCIWVLRVVWSRLFLPSLHLSHSRRTALLSRECALVRICETRRLARLFGDWCASLRVRAPKDAFTRWLLTARMLEPADRGDWLLPSLGGRDGGLEHELAKAGVRAADAIVLAERLGEASRRAVRQVMLVADAQLRADDAGVAQLMSKLGPLTDADREFVRTAELVSPTRTDDLRRRHERSDGAAAANRTFEQSMTAMTMSYGAMGGGAADGEGYHGSVTPATFDALRSHCGVRAECFASPLNFTLADYWSAFGTAVDGPFGSLGSFFEPATCEYFCSQGGAFEANPPFLEEHMLAMALAFEIYLTQCTKPLSFVVFVPQWRDSPYFELLTQSSFKRAHFDAQKGHHQYLRGFNHRDTHSQSMISYAHTTVFFLQNDAAFAQKPFDSSVVEVVAASMRQGMK